MASNIEYLARKFESQLAPKTAAKRGTKMNAKKLHKELEKARKEYKECRSRLVGLESDLESIEGKIHESRDGQRSSRSKMFKMREVLQNMDLCDAKYAVLYDDEAADVGYIISGEEQHLDLTDDGEVRLTPMPKRRSELRRQKREDAAAEDEGEIPPSIADDEDYDGEEPEEPQDADDEDDEEEDEEDDNGSDDYNFSDDYRFIMHPNLRFID